MTRAESFDDWYAKRTALHAMPNLKGFLRLAFYDAWKRGQDALLDKQRLDTNEDIL
jgi:hypothetical protein